jgi:NitT/TauT family transport system substrate-binding protein
MKLFLPVFCLVLLCAGSVPAQAAEKYSPAPPAAKKLLIYTALTATTPQIPLWAAIRSGWAEGYAIEVEYWKTLDDLRGVMLAGKGDLWVGHLEGFAQAARRGAPVTLLAVTGWKKFYFVAPAGDAAALSLDSLAQALRDSEEPLAVAPQDSPAIAILEDMGSRGVPAFAVAAMPPQQLMLEMLRGSRRYALLPEPMVSALLAKAPGLRVAASLEEEFARRFGGPGTLPLAGIAVRTGFAAENPELVRELVSAMQTAAGRLAADPESAAEVLPERVRETIGQDVLRNSLSRDLIHVAPAASARDEILSFLRRVLPQSQAPGAPDLPPSEHFFLPQPK